MPMNAPTIVPAFSEKPDGPFDFLSALDRYKDDPLAIHRLNRRYEAIVAPFQSDIQNATVLDLASHDGRWPYALSYAGAREVLGIEARGELIEQFDEFPASDHTQRVTLVQGDIFDQIRLLIESEATVDVVAVFGIFYHITEHYLLLSLLKRLQPLLIIIDSEFARDAQGPILRFARERTDNPLNATDRGAGEVELVAVPSPQLIELMADVLGYRADWVSWKSLPGGHRDGVQDYFRSGEARRRRGTVALRRK